MWAPMTFSMGDIGKEKQDCDLNDLKEENAELRRQMVELYQHLAKSPVATVKISPSSDAFKKKKSSKDHLFQENSLLYSSECGSIQSMEAADKMVAALENEITIQQVHIKEQAKTIKDIEKKLQSKEDELLKLSLEIVQNIPLKAQLKQMKKKIEELESQNYSSKVESSTWHEKVNRLHHLNQELQQRIVQYEEEISSLSERSVMLEGERVHSNLSFPW